MSSSIRCFVPRDIFDEQDMAISCTPEDKESSPSQPIVINKSSGEREESSLATAKTTADEGNFYASACIQLHYIQS